MSDPRKLKPKGKVWKNILSYSAGQASMALFGLVISAVLARYMSKPAFGQFSYFVAIATLVLPILDVGTTGLYVRLSSRDRDKIGPHWARTIGLRLYSIPFTAAIVALYFYFADGSVGIMLLLVMLYAVAQSVMLSTDVAFRAAERGHAWAIRRTIYEVAYFVMTLVGLAVFRLTTPTQQYIIAILALVFAAAWASFTVVRMTGLTWKAFAAAVSSPLNMAEFKILWPFAVNGVLFVFYYRMTAVFIEHFGTPAELADFRVVFVVMTSALYIPRAIIWASSPRMAWHDEQKNTEKFRSLLRQSADMNLFVSVFITLGGLLYGSRLIGIVFGHKYSNLGLLWYVIDLSMGLFFIQQFCTDLLNNFKKERHVVTTFVAGILVLTVLNLLLIPKLGALGAAWARFAAGCLMVPINLRAAAQLAGWSGLNGMNLWRFGAVNAAAAAVGYALLPVNLWLSIVAFAAVYGGFGYLFKAMPERLEALLSNLLRSLRLQS